jgi:hypothetical protein
LPEVYAWAGTKEKPMLLIAIAFLAVVLLGLLTALE